MALLEYILNELFTKLINAGNAEPLAKVAA